jgi:hypothetical protein
MDADDTYPSILDGNMRNPKSFFIGTEQHREKGLTPLKPALASLVNGRKYLGDPSNSKFNADILPELETIKFKDTDKRRYIVVASMDRLIEARRTVAASISTTAVAEAAQAAVGPALGQHVSRQDPATRTYRHCAEEPTRNRQGAENGE